MHVRVSEDAERDLSNIENYIKPRNELGYERIVGAIHVDVLRILHERQQWPPTE